MIQVREYLAKAEEFLLAATAELETGRSITATSLALHAGINAADAVCGARLKERAAGQDHREVIKLLGRAGDDGSQLAKDLQRLLPLKTTAGYEPDTSHCRKPPRRWNEPRDVSMSPAGSSGPFDRQAMRTPGGLAEREPPRSGH